MNRRKWGLAIVGAGAIVAADMTASAQEAKKDDKEREEMLTRRAALMKKMEERLGQKLNVSPTDGMFLKILTESIHAKRVLEIGSSNGYAALWIGQALERTGGRLWTVEIDAGRAKKCRENIKEAGLEKTVTSIEDDAFKAIPQLEGPYDMVFINGWKNDYKRYLDLVLPKVRAGGVIVAHGTVERAKDMADYLDAVNNSADLDTVTLTAAKTPKGMTISYKKK
jgi:predicted O-methyltransferase YrrM